MSAKERNLALASFDDLFRTDEERKDNNLERVQRLPLDMFFPFPNHPFKVRDDEKMEETVESVTQYGILVPILARPRVLGGYEIVSGHRRVHACQRAGLEEIPAIIRDMTDDEAILIMVDSNLQREQILPSEKAFAYKMKLEAMNRQGKRTDLTSTQVVSKLRSNEMLGEQVGESRETIRRYIRLTYLAEPLLDMVDENSLAFNAAVEVSYLSEKDQDLLVEAIAYNEESPSLSQARRIRQFSVTGKLSSDVLNAILSEEKPLDTKVTLRGDKLKKYFPDSYTPRQMEQVITRLLEEWSRRQREGTERGR